MRVSSIVFVIALGFTASACDEKLSDVAGPSPNLQPTFSSIQRDIFSATDSAGRAACTQCHSGATPASGLTLGGATTYNELVNVVSNRKPGAIRVIPGNPDDSYLVQKLEGRSDIVGQRMPRTGGPYLTAGQMSIIRRWIALGAKND